MATLVNNLNWEVKVIIPNMRESRVFYSDNEGSVMFFKRDWHEDRKQIDNPMPEDTVLFQNGVKEGRRLEREDMWKPSETQMKYLLMLADYFESEGGTSNAKTLRELYENLKKL